MAFGPMGPGERGASVKTNLLASRSDGLKQLEESLSRSFDMFSPKSSVDAMTVPQTPVPRAVVPNRAVKSDQQRRKDWLLGDQNEPSDLKDLLKSPLDDSDKEKSRFGSDSDSIFDRLNKTAKKPTKPGEDPFGKTYSDLLKRGGTDDEANLPSGVKETAKELRKLLGIDNGAFAPKDEVEPRSSLSDIFGLNSRKLTEKDIEDHKAYMDSYRQVLAGAQVATADPLNSTFGQRPAAATYAPGLDAYTSSSLQNRNLYGSTEGSTRVPTLPDLNARALNQWNPLYTPPPPLEPARATPPKPNFDAPRRKF